MLPPSSSSSSSPLLSPTEASSQSASAVFSQLPLCSSSTSFSQCFHWSSSLRRAPVVRHQHSHRHRQSQPLPDSPGLVLSGVIFSSSFCMSPLQYIATCMVIPVQFGYLRRRSARSLVRHNDHREHPCVLA